MTDRVDSPTVPSEVAGSADRSRLELVGEIIGEKYRVVERLGAGGMGAVYRAEHVTLGVDVALKTMHAHVASQVQYVRRFVREARAMSVVVHPNVVRVLDFGTHEGVPYLAMEYLRGESLDVFLSSARPLRPIAVCVEILLAVLEGLAVAHDAGIVHRDLKPDNVFLAEEHGAIVPKLVDFGLAHVDDERDAGPTLTKTEMIAGTPDYMSPEQCRSLRVGPSTDLYAVGCILTTMLQGAPPFSGESTIDVIAKHMFAPVPPLSRPEGAAPVGEALERLRLDLLQKDPAQRPASAREVYRRLREAIDPTSLAARMGQRSGDSLAPREARAPWAEAVHAPPVAAAGTVALVSLGSPSLGEPHRLALAAAGLSVVSEGTGPDSPDVVVIDAGDDLAAALDALAVRQGAQAIVCLAHLDVPRMNALVAAGARDTIAAPVATDALSRKVARLCRRKRPQARAGDAG